MSRTGPVYLLFGSVGVSLPSLLLNAALSPRVSKLHRLLVCCSVSCSFSETIRRLAPVSAQKVDFTAPGLTESGGSAWNRTTRQTDFMKEQEARSVPGGMNTGPLDTRIIHSTWNFFKLRMLFKLKAFHRLIRWNLWMY